ncbi:hypothetical protein ABPG75_005603 [Micractinium tetrahymenae]
MPARRPAGPGLLALGLALLALCSLAASQQAFVEDATCYWAGPRVPCGSRQHKPDPGLSEANCRAAGCCWAPPAFADAPHGAPPGGPAPADLPWCFATNNAPSTYSVAGLISGANSTAPTALAATGPFAALLHQTNATSAELGPDVPALHAEVASVAPDILRLRLLDASEPRWQVPASLYHPTSLLSQLLNPAANATSAAAAAPGGTSASPGSTAAPPLQYALQRSDQPFAVVVTRNASGLGASPGPSATLLNTTSTRLVYKARPWDQYLELTTWLSPSAVLFGGGSPNRGTTVVPRTGYPLVSWNRDFRPNPTETVNSYGTSTLIIAVDGGVAHGYLMLNSNGLEVVPQPDRLTWRMIGGVVDLFILSGPTPLDVMRQYAELVGRPALPPYWALGLNHRFTPALGTTYKDCSAWEQVMANYSAAGVPVEAFSDWGDSTDSFRLFTLGPAWRDCWPAALAGLHARGQRWVDPSWQFYTAAQQQGALLLDAYNNSLLGQLFPGPSTFLDWASQPALQLFGQGMKQFASLAPFDGAAVSYAEPTSFCAGDVCDLAMQTFADNLTGPWDWEALGTCPWCGCYMVECRSVQCTHSGCTSLEGLPAQEGSLAFPPYAINSLNVGVYSSLLATRPGMRPFVMSRSGFPGDSAFAATWNGNACWDCHYEDLAMGPAQVINMGLSGYGLAGADISCLGKHYTPLMCAQWVATAAFYPLMRVHDQELYRWPESTVAARAALALRFWLLPYIYSLLYTGTQTGAPALRPLWMAFPEDNNTLAIPAANTTWGGSILPIQPAHKGNTTAAVKASPLSFLVALPALVPENATADAGGDVFNDDGESLQAPAGSCTLLNATATIAYDAPSGRHNGTLLLWLAPQGSGQAMPQGAGAPLPAWPQLGNVTILGWSVPVSNATVAVLQSGGSGPSAADVGADLAAAVPAGTTVASTSTIPPCPMPTGAALPGPAQGGGACCASAGSLLFDLAGMHVPLNCGSGVLLTWQEA